jgi:hypothetical protein
MPAAATIVLDPLLPVPAVVLLALLLGVATHYTYRRVGSRVPRWQNNLLTTGRLLAVALVLVLLLQPSRIESLPAPTIDKCTLVALDTSLSMKQTDAGKVARLDAAKALLTESALVSRDGRTGEGRLRFFEFGEDALPAAGSPLELQPKAPGTRLHRSVSTTLNSLASGEGARALILLTDGHDFELVNPQKTGFLARSRQVPIYAVPIGRAGKVRDVATRITSFQPYTYVKQKARLGATLRLIGCEFEELNAQLLRQGVVAQTRKLNADEHQTLNVEFEVVEPVVGQYEYEVRVLPLQQEVDLANNSAITYLNVIDQQIKVLVLEGAPYWDTTFLQRSLMRNDKTEVEALVQYAPKKVRPIRKTPSDAELRVPATAQEFARYDLVILGRSVDQLLSRAQLDAMQAWVRDQGGAVIFSRGKAFEGELAKNDLEPVIWSENFTERPRLATGRDGASVAPFKTLNEIATTGESPPELVAGRTATEQKPLTATLAVAKSSEDAQPLAGIVHRRFGQGQVISIGVEGLWRWAFNAKVEGVNTFFDRFWDQMVLWLMAGRDFVPNTQFSFRTSSANVQKGEKVFFRLVMRTFDPSVKSVPLALFHGDTPVGNVAFTSAGADSYRLTAEFLPAKTGRYRAVASFPDGTRQESRFIVYEENLEETEVTTDVAYLKRLCESSGGRLLKPEELGKLVSELRDEKVDATPKTRLVSLWDRAWVFWLIGALFGVDWFLRRRWGLC